MLKYQPISLWKCLQTAYFNTIKKEKNCLGRHAPRHLLAATTRIQQNLKDFQYFQVDNTVIGTDSGVPMSISAYDECSTPKNTQHAACRIDITFCRKEGGYYDA